jgi:hypothetical protein
MRWRSPSRPRCSGLIGSVGWRRIWSPTGHNRPLVPASQFPQCGHPQLSAGARLVTCSSSNTATLREVSSHQLAAVALFSEHSNHNAILDSLFSSGLFRLALSGRSPAMALEQDSIYRDKAHRACCGGLGAISMETPKVVVAVELISRCV